MHRDWNYLRRQVAEMIEAGLLPRPPSPDGKAPPPKPSDLSKGEKAMGIAMLYPDTSPGKRTEGSATTLSETNKVSATRISIARTVRRHSLELAEAVRDGTVKLDEALEPSRPPPPEPPIIPRIIPTPFPWHPPQEGRASRFRWDPARQGWTRTPSPVRS